MLRVNDSATISLVVTLMQHLQSNATEGTCVESRNGLTGDDAPGIWWL